MLAAGSLITSGGGFSSTYPAPSYQKEAVTSWVQQHGAKLPAGTFNAKNRGYPDIAVTGHSFPIILNGKRVMVLPNHSVTLLLLVCLLYLCWSICV